MICYEITLASLRKMAEALDCEVKYALVPKQALKEMREVQANQVARKRMSPVAHSMKLEAQTVDADIIALQHQDLVDELLSGSGRKLWP